MNWFREWKVTTGFTRERDDAVAESLNHEETTHPHGLRLPIDFFFRALVQEPASAKFDLDLSRYSRSIRTMQLGRTTHTPVSNSRRVVRTRGMAVICCGQMAFAATVRSCGGCPGSFCHSAWIGGRVVTAAEDAGANTSKV